MGLEEVDPDMDLLPAPARVMALPLLGSLDSLRQSMAHVEAGKLAKTQARLNRLEANRKRPAGADGVEPHAKKPKQVRSDKPAKPANSAKSAKPAKNTASGGPEVPAGMLGVADKAEKMRGLHLQLDIKILVARQSWCRRMGRSVPPTPPHLVPYI